jgi:L-fuconolactonase
VLIVDTHCHASDNWYEPVEVLLGQMERNGVAHAALIQMNGQTNNAYQRACVQKYPGKFASVVIVDTNRADAPAALAREAELGASGVRFRATTRSPGEDPLAIWRAAEKLGLSVSCLGSAGEFAADEFAAVVQAVPNLKIVVEHLASSNHPGDQQEEELRQRAFGVARFPNVYIKIHGLGEFTRRAMPVREPFAFETPIPPIFDQVYAAFGPGRMMWGSDFPPVAGREGYHHALYYSIEQFASKGDAEREQIFGKTALSVFPVR